MGKVLTLSGSADSSLFDTTIESGHEDDVLRDVFALLFFRYHKVDEGTLRQYVIPKRILNKTPLYELARNRCHRWNKNHKKSNMDFYFKGAKLTLKLMNNKEAIMVANKAQRRVFWETI